MLFVWVQVAHAFDVPARRDLAFSLAGSASLMAVAAAQAIDLGFGAYVLVWLAFGLAGLLAMWSSASRGGRLRAARRGRHLGGRRRHRRRRARRPARSPCGGTDRLPRQCRVREHPPGPGRSGRRRQGGTARQTGKPRRRHPGGRLSGIRQSSRHGAARWTERHRGHAGPGRPSVVLDRGDLRHLGRRQLERAFETTRLAATGRELTVRHPRTVAGVGDGTDRPADLLHRPAVAQPGLPRRQRARGVVPGPRPLRLRQRLDRLSHRARSRGHLHGAVLRRHARA